MNSKMYLSAKYQSEHFARRIARFITWGIGAEAVCNDDNAIKAEIRTLETMECKITL